MNIKPIKREYIILTGLVIAILWALSYMLVFKPMAGALKAKKAIIEKKLVEINNARSAKANLDRLKTELAEIEKKESYYKDKLPAEKEIPAFLKGFTDMANQCRIRFITIQPQDPSSHTSQTMPYMGIPITINLKCSYHDLGRFINLIESSGRFMKVTDLTINASPSDPIVHDVRLIVDIFVLKKR